MLHNLLWEHELTLCNPTYVDCTSRITIQQFIVVYSMHSLHSSLGVTRTLAVIHFVQISMYTQGVKRFIYHFVSTFYTIHDAVAQRYRNAQNNCKLQSRSGQGLHLHLATIVLPLRNCNQRRVASKSTKTTQNDRNDRFV